MSDLKDFDMVKALRDINQRMGQTEVAERPRTNYGSSFPASWPNNVPFFRTDLGWWAYFDGTRWLTAHEMPIPVQALATFTGPGTLGGTITALRTDYAPYFTRYEVETSVATTNNGTNFWTIDLIGINLAFTTVTVIANPNTSADAVGTRVQHAGNAGTPAPSDRQFIRGRFSTTGAPGVLEVTISTWYRLIIP